MVAEILVHSNLAMYHQLKMLPRGLLLSLHSGVSASHLSPPLPLPFIDSSSAQMRSNLVPLAMRESFASKAGTLFLHRCPLGANQVLDLLRVPSVLLKSVPDGSVSVVHR